MRRGFSIVELLVSIGVISILISLLLPALAGVRQNAKSTVSLSNGKQIGLSFNAYADRFGAYPYADERTRLEGMPVSPLPDLVTLPWWPEGTVLATSEHWMIEHMWPALLDSVAPWEENYALWVSPGMDTRLPDVFEIDFDSDDPIREQVRISWLYSTSFLADPKLWDEGAEPDRALRRAIKPHEVQLASNKVMLWDADLAWLADDPEVVDGHYRALTPMVFADLHAAVHVPTEATAGATNPLTGSDMKLNNTPNGVHGYDY